MKTEKCSGILFISSKGTGLFLKRSDHGPKAYHYVWGLPGGHLRPSETHEQAARRETREEIGQCPKGPLYEVARQISILEGDDKEYTREIDYTTFIMEIEHEFIPLLNKEHSEFIWAPLDNPPEPIHPGLAITLQKMNSDELGIAELMRDGKLTSPQKYGNITLFNIRITGTGLAYRSGLNEYVWRDKSLYLNDRFLARCNGLPVIFEHPEKATLNTKEYIERNIGTVFLPYIKDDEVWAIVKIWDDYAASVMENNQLSTSPAVVLGNNDKYTELDNGDVLLIEDVPKLLDHVAICRVGVWDKSGSPVGVSSTSIEKELVMADEDDKAAALEAARKEKHDADESEFKASGGGGGGAGETLDKTLKCLDSMTKRMDAFEEFEKEKEKKKADKKARKDAKRAAKADEKTKTDAQRKADAEEEEKKKADEKAKADAKAKTDAEEEVRKRFADVEAKLPKQMTDADYSAVADSQAKADRIYLMHGSRAFRPMDGEIHLAYRKRLVDGLKDHSPAWKDIDISSFVTDAKAFANIENQIYADAENAGLNPVAPSEGFLREIIEEDVTGRKISKFVGRPSAWMNQFAPNKRRLIGIRNH